MWVALHHVVSIPVKTFMFDGVDEAGVSAMVFNEHGIVAAFVIFTDARAVCQGSLDAAVFVDPPEIAVAAAAALACAATQTAAAAKETAAMAAATHVEARFIYVVGGYPWVFQRRVGGFEHF